MLTSFSCTVNKTEVTLSNGFGDAMISKYRHLTLSLPAYIKCFFPIPNMEYACVHSISLHIFFRWTFPSDLLPLQRALSRIASMPSHSRIFNHLHLSLPLHLSRNKHQSLPPTTSFACSSRSLFGSATLQVPFSLFLRFRNSIVLIVWFN